MAPGSELQRPRQPGILVGSELRLADDQGRIANPEIQAVAVTSFRIAEPRTGRIAVEDRQQKRHVLAVSGVFYARARRGILRARPAWTTDRPGRRPADWPPRWSANRST